MCGTEIECAPSSFFSCGIHWRLVAKHGEYDVHCFTDALVDDDFIHGALCCWRLTACGMKSLKALEESFSSKNYVRNFLRALHPKWRAKVTVIEESKDLSSLSLNELIGNHKDYAMIMEKDSELVRGKRKKIESLALKAKRESNDDENLMSGSEDKEYTTTVREFKSSLGEEVEL
nr:UBN2 domain-containing protein [Tanacetum cinerariifolium]